MRLRIALFLVFALFPAGMRGESPLTQTQGEPDPVLEALAEEALALDPDLREIHESRLAAQKEAVAAGALPDPMFSLTYENDGAKPSLGEEGMTRLELMAQQAFPYPGTQRLAAEIAKKGASRMSTRQARRVLTVKSAVKKAYAGLLEARETLLVTTEQISIWEGMEEITRSRYAAGLASQKDVLRAQSERTRLERQKRRDETAERLALVELRRLTGRKAANPVRTERRLKPGLIPALAPLETLLKTATDDLPELKDAWLVKERALLSEDLARKSLLPGFVATAGYGYRGSLPMMWTVGLGVSVPLWASEKQKPLIERARHLFAAATAAEESTKRQILALTEERWERLRLLADEALIDADGILVQERLAVDASLATFQTGGTPFTAVLETLSTYFSSQREAVVRLAGIERAMADLYEFSLENRSASMNPPTEPSSATTPGATSSSGM